MINSYEIYTPKILIIYTGGTIGMIHEPHSNALIPFDFKQINKKVPELKKFGYHIDTINFTPPVDSSDINPQIWIRIVNIIEKNYQKYNGFVILHGTDTMSYSAAALSFMLENLQKPVIFTGSQLPIGTLRTDGKENLITAIEIAAAQRNKQPLVPEVCIYFENKLYRGNRTKKHNAEHFAAFRSYNYPPLAEAGIHIKYNYQAINYSTHFRELKVHTSLDNHVAILKIFPGIHPRVVDSILNINKLKAVVIETFGSGNAMTNINFINKLKAANKRGLILLNVTQCNEGSVDMGLYKSSLGMEQAGVISGFDITVEAAVTKLMFLLGRQSYSLADVKRKLRKSLAGEVSIHKTGD